MGYPANGDAVPTTSKMTMRPVWKRRQKRVYAIGNLGEPTELEIQDAIRVLEDEDNETFAPALWLEAFKIFDEASQDPTKDVQSAPSGR